MRPIDSNMSKNSTAYTSLESSAWILKPPIIINGCADIIVVSRLFSLIRRTVDNHQFHREWLKFSTQLRNLKRGLFYILIFKTVILSLCRRAMPPPLRFVGRGLMSSYPLGMIAKLAAVSSTVNQRLTHLNPRSNRAHTHKTSRLWLDWTNIH